MQYISFDESDATTGGHRNTRAQPPSTMGWTLKEVAERSGVSTRFLSILKPEKATFRSRVSRMSPAPSTCL